MSNPSKLLPLLPKQYELIRKDAEDFVERKKRRGLIHTPEEERIERQSYIEAIMELWPEFKPRLEEAIKRKRMEISLR